jgi:hypothetical protein
MPFSSTDVAAVAETRRASRSPAAALALAGVVAVALALRWWPGGWTDERAYWRRDETNYFLLVSRFLNGRFDVREFINPTLYAYVVAGAGALVGGMRRLLGMDASFDLFVARETAVPHVVIGVGRVISILASAGSVLVVASVGRRLFSDTVGVIAGLLLAIDACAADSAPLCGNESLMVLLGLLAIRAAIGGSSLRRRLASGLLLGLATSSKYSAGILAIPIAVAFRRRVGPSALMAAVGFALGSPMALVNFGDFVRGFTTQAGFLHAGYHEEDRLRHELGFVYYVRTFGEAHQGVVLASLCAAGVVASLTMVALRRDRGHALLLAASLPLYLFLGSGIFNDGRFLLPAIPFLLIHGAWLLERLLMRVAFLRSRPTAALAAGIAVVVAFGAPSTARHRELFRREFASPEPPLVLVNALKPWLPPQSRVAELAISNVFRLLLPDDPWIEMGLPEPADEVRRSVDAWLASHDLLPTSTSLALLIAGSESLAELQEKLRSAGVDTLVVDVPTHQLFFGPGIRPAPGDVRLRACPYWSELVDWLASLPRRRIDRSSDQRITAAVLDLGTGPR